MRFERLTLLLGILVLFAVPVSAQDDDQTEKVDYASQLGACRQIEDDPQRLACFDRISGELIAATDSGDVRIINRGEVEKSKRRLFGFSLPSIGLFGGDDEPMELLETKITSVRYVRGKQIIFSTEEGAVWQINNPPRRLKPVEVGNSVIFKKAAMGTFFIRIQGQMGVKGRRVR